MIGLPNDAPLFCKSTEVYTVVSKTMDLSSDDPISSHAHPKLVIRAALHRPQAHANGVLALGFGVGFKRLLTARSILSY